MWRITTRGFTLQEVLILAAMNIATRTGKAVKRDQEAAFLGAQNILALGLL